MSTLFEYPVNGGAASAGGGIDDYSVVPISIERIPIYPLSEGVTVGMPEDDGRQRNRVDIEHTEYDYRVYALTLMQSSPQLSSIVQHVMQENAEQYSVRTAQQPPYTVDLSQTLPYLYPSNVADMAPSRVGYEEYL